jgi:hypothetical protein
MNYGLLEQQCRRHLSALPIFPQRVSKQVFTDCGQAIWRPLQSDKGSTVAIEAAYSGFWRKYVGRSGMVVGIASFCEAASAKDLYSHFGFTAQRVVVGARARVQRAACHREVLLPEQFPVSSNWRLAMQKSFDLVMFDLNGMLIETAPEIWDAVNDTSTALISAG